VYLAFNPTRRSRDESGLCETTALRIKMKVKWYFDYVSPFSYLQWAHQVPRLENVEIEFKPVLFAGLLKHWDHKGPAEIDDKRRYTYRHIVWLAGRFGVPLRLPAGHPFNPLPLLRAGIACGDRPDVVDRLFGFVWRDGHIPTQNDAWARLLRDLDVSQASLEDPAVKQRLRANGEEAIAARVFGVPSFVADGEVFWGVDGFDFFLDYLADPGILAASEMRAADELPGGL